MTAADLAALCGSFKTAIFNATGERFPQDPRQQLDAAVEAVFRSWSGDRAVLYRRQERIPNDLGTAVNIQTMVFGNMSDDSGTGVCFTRDPSTGDVGVYGDFLMNAQGEDVVAGIRNARPLHELEGESPAAYRQLLDNMSALEAHYHDLCDIEFTIERGTLWMLQTRVGKRTAEAAFRIAGQLIDEGVISEEEALTRVNGAQLSQLMFPRFDTVADRTLLATGMNASPGAAVGRVVFDSETAVDWAARGENVILVRKETNPDDLSGMVAARGVLTSRGGKTSHAAVVARGMGRTCVCGAEALDVDAAARKVVVRGGPTVSEGDVISIDGTTGEVLQAPTAEYTRRLVAERAGSLRPSHGSHKASEETLLSLDGVSAGYSGLRILNEVSLSLQRGETLAVVGESGPGKTTLGRCLLPRRAGLSLRRAGAGRPVGHAADGAQLRGLRRRAGRPRAGPDRRTAHPVTDGPARPGRGCRSSAGRWRRPPCGGARMSAARRRCWRSRRDDRRAALAETPRPAADPRRGRTRPTRDRRRPDRPARCDRRRAAGCPPGRRRWSTCPSRWGPATPWYCPDRSSGRHRARRRRCAEQRSGRAGRSLGRPRGASPAPPAVAPRHEHHQRHRHPHQACLL